MGCKEGKNNRWPFATKISWACTIYNFCYTHFHNSLASFCFCPLFSLNSSCTSWFGKAMMHDEMKRDNGSLGLEYLPYVESISAATQVFTFTNGVKIFHWSNYLLLKIFCVINFHWWILLTKLFTNKFFQTTVGSKFTSPKNFYVNCWITMIIQIGI